jgi:hypothetical protein
MINILLTPTIFLGVLFILGFLVLFLLRTVRCEVSEDSDVFFSSIGLLYSFIIIIHGWRLDPILFFGQSLVAILLFGLGWQMIRLRGLLHDEKQKTEENHDG